MVQSENHLASYDDENVPWYIPELKNLDPAARELLEEYSGLSPERVVPHIERVRDKAFALFKYPCIGEFRFVELQFSKLPFYNHVLERVQQGETLLDLGCCFGQDIRKLVADGAPTANIYGSDVLAQFFELGYELFRDKATLDCKFITADVFAETSSLDELSDSVDIIVASNFLHLFTWDQQKTIAHRALKLLKKRYGSMMVGRMVGNSPHGADIYRSGQGNMFRHDPETFKTLWYEVSAESGVRFGIEVQFEESDAWLEINPNSWHSTGSKPLLFAVSLY